MSNYGCQQHLINPSKDLSAILEFLCGESAKLSNCGTYYARKFYFKTGKIPSKLNLHKLFKSNVFTRFSTMLDYGCRIFQVIYWTT